MSKRTSFCAVCGKKYELCISCDEKSKLNPWKRHTDTAEHYKIYQILRGYSTGVYTETEAKKKLESVDLSDFNDLRGNIKEIIKKLVSVNVSENGGSYETHEGVSDDTNKEPIKSKKKFGR